jgi:hypothetical protein
MASYFPFGIFTAFLIYVGVQPQPRDPVLVKLAASVLCNLTHKTISAGTLSLVFKFSEIIATLCYGYNAVLNIMLLLNQSINHLYFS